MFSDTTFPRSAVLAAESLTATPCGGFLERPLGFNEFAGGRHMKNRRVATVVVLLCMLRLPGWSQDQEKGHGVASKPQLQVFFSKLETQWFDAIKDRDQAALNLIVSDDFHLWTSARLGT